MKKLMYAAACLAALIACSKEQEEPVQANEQLNGSQTVLATAKDFTTVGEAKTVITQSGNDAPSFAWKEGDVIGIIPMNGKTVQSNYEIAEIGSNPRNASFDGGVWALKEGEEYAAYYPFNEQIARSGDNLEFSFLGQTQSANNSLEHLGAYDYMYASAVVPKSGSAQFDFEHKISLVRLQLTVPKADTYTKVVLESSIGWFANGASLKLSNGTLTATATVKSTTINLNNIAITSGSVLTVWFATLPTSAMSGQTLSVKLFGGKYTCTGEITGLSALTAGSAYSYSATLSSQETGMEYVDLGLPSGLKWATCNLGANSPEEYGDYYAWGETETKSEYIEETYKYYKSEYIEGYTDEEGFEHPGYRDTGFTKYIPQSRADSYGFRGFYDNKTVLDPEDDVAHVKLGGKWRMPTIADFDELINNCQCDRLGYKGVMGMKFTSKKTGYTDKWIFLPAKDFGREYWSSSLSMDAADPYILFFGTDFVDTSVYPRYIGNSVRPVLGADVTEVSLDKTNLEMYQGQSSTLTATLFPASAGNREVSWASDNTKVVTVDENGKVTAVGAGTATITVTTKEGSYTATCAVIVMSWTELVDLGLSVKWRGWNIGASKPEEYGKYFSWGDVQDNTSGKTANTNCGLDANGNLMLEYDAAHVILGGKWRMPTKAECQELIDNCTSVWTTVNGVSGCLFISKKEGYTDRFIFMPAAGSYSTGRYISGSGSYWSGTFIDDDISGAFGLTFFISTQPASGKIYTWFNIKTYSNYRGNSCSVRPVSE